MELPKKIGLSTSCCGISIYGIILYQMISYADDIISYRIVAYCIVSYRIVLYQITSLSITEQSKTVFTSLVLSIMLYADIIWSSCSSKSQSALQKVQNRGFLRCIHNITNSRAKSYRIADLLHQTGWIDLATRRQSHMCILTYKTVTGDVPLYLIPLNIRYKQHICTRLNIDLQTEIKFEKLSWHSQDTQSDWKFSFKCRST